MSHDLKRTNYLLTLLCRICGQENRNCVPVFSEEGMRQSIQKKIRTCLTISVEETDQLPKQICFACLNKLDTAYDLLLLSKEGKILIGNKLNQASGQRGQESNLCGICNEIVEEEGLGLGCEGPCQRWFHITCVNVSQLQYNEFVNDPSKIWICDRCKNPKITSERYKSKQELLVNSIDIKLSSLKENEPIKFGETAMISLAPSNSPPPTKDVVAPVLAPVLQPQQMLVSNANSYIQAPAQVTPTVTYPSPSKEGVYPQTLIQRTTTNDGKPVMYQVNNNNERRIIPCQPTVRATVPAPKPKPTTRQPIPVPAKRRALREGENNIPQPKKSNQMCKYCNKTFPDDIIDHHVNLHLRQTFITCLECNKNFRSEEAMSRHRCGASDSSKGNGPINLTEDSDDEPICV